MQASRSDPHCATYDTFRWLSCEMVIRFQPAGAARHPTKDDSPAD